MNNFLSFQIHGDAETPGLAGAVEVLLKFLEGLLDKSVAEVFSLIFPGVAALENIHPLVVHFPIAFLSSFFVLDLIASFIDKNRWREFAALLLYLGTCTALFTVIAGFLAAKNVPHADNVHEIMERHEMIGISILSLATILSVWRLKSGGVISGEINILHQLLAAILCLLLVLGADLGGLMVYKYGVAVEPVTKTMSKSFDAHSHDSTNNHQQHNH